MEQHTNGTAEVGTNTDAPQTGTVATSPQKTNPYPHIARKKEPNSQNSTKQWYQFVVVAIYRKAKIILVCSVVGAIYLYNQYKNKGKRLIITTVEEYKRFLAPTTT